MTKKIMIVVDTKKWIIGKLSEAIIKYNPHFEFKYYALHPRDVEQKIEEFKKAVEEFKPDIIHFQYYRSCSQALDLWPELRDYKIILTHHNQRTKAVHHKKWQELGVNQLVCHTNKCSDMLKENGEKNVEIIQHGLDFDYFKFSAEEPEHPRIGYVGRVVPWKGLLEICKVARELDMKVLLMGVIDKPEYWRKVEEYKDVLDMNYYNCKDEERLEAYQHMTIYVGNSIDGYEEGPMGLLEAWACGVPVVTTPTGEAKDLVVECENAMLIPFKDEEGSYEVLKGVIKYLMSDENKDVRKKLRKNGWNTVKNMPEQKMARQYSSLYYKVGGEGKLLVSVIIPATYDREKEVEDILKSLEKQTVKNIEAIIVWDEELSATIKWKQGFKFPIKFLCTCKEGYNLAMARNMGIVEAEGDYIMFNDARLNPELDAIENFLKATSIPATAPVWFFGDKGAGKKSFVENFSFVERSEVVKFGMLNERMSCYGGLSQEIRTRWKLQGNIFHFVEDARAKELKSSKLTQERRRDIIKSKFKLFKIYKNVSF